MASNAKRKNTGWSVFVSLSVASVLYGLLVYLEPRHLVQANLIAPACVVFRVLILVAFVPLVLILVYRKYTSG